MEYIQRLPFILGTLMAIITGVISYEYGVEQQEIYLKMAISMIVFFTIGVFIRNTIIKIADENRIKKIEEENRKKTEEENRKKTEEENRKKTEEENRKKADEEKQNNEKIDKNEAKDLKNARSSAIDYAINDKSDDFQPLKVSEIIRNELKK